MADLFDKEEEKAEKRKEQGFMPLRFWLAPEDGCEVIVLDASLEDGLAIREHNLKGSDGKFGNFEMCLADTGSECPVCKRYGEEGYLVLLLTVLVLKEWRSKKTNELHQYSKMLLPVKRGQFKSFRRLEQLCVKKHGTMRGMLIELERPKDQQSSAIGEPIPLQDGSAFDLYTEKDLIAEFGHKEVANREGKIVKPANEDIKPFPYKKLFPEPTEEELADRYGVDPAPGSRRANQEALSEGGGDAGEGSARQRRQRRGGEAETSQPAAGAVRERRRRPAPEGGAAASPSDGFQEEDDIPFN